MVEVYQINTRVKKNYYEITIQNHLIDKTYRSHNKWNHIKSVVPKYCNDHTSFKVGIELEKVISDNFTYWARVVVYLEKNVARTWNEYLLNFIQHYIGLIILFPEKSFCTIFTKKIQNFMYHTMLRNFRFV